MKLKDFRKLLHGADPDAEVRFRPDWLAVHVFERQHLVTTGAVERSECQPDKSVKKIVEIGITAMPKENDNHDN